MKMSHTLIKLLYSQRSLVALQPGIKMANYLSMCQPGVINNKWVKNH